VSTIDGITVPDDLLWSDEFASWRVAQAQRTSLTGALIVHQSLRQAGRPVTLESQQDGSRWVAPVSLDVLNALRASEEAGGAPFPVVLPDHNSGARTLTCTWRSSDGNAIVARPLRFIAPYADGDLFAVTLRLIQVD